jgi:hypothetical protein
MGKAFQSFHKKEHILHSAMSAFNKFGLSNFITTFFFEHCKGYKFSIYTAAMKVKC